MLFFYNFTRATEIFIMERFKYQLGINLTKKKGLLPDFKNSSEKLPMPFYSKIIIFYGRIIWYVLRFPPCFGFCFLKSWMSHEKLCNIYLSVIQISVEKAFSNFFLENISLKFYGTNSDAIRLTDNS